MLDLAFQLDRKQAKRLLSNADSDGVAVLLALCSLLGTADVIGDDADEPADLFNRAEEALGIQLAVENEAKFLALKNALETDLVHTRVPTFCVFVNSLNDGDTGLDDGSVDIPDFPEINWADFVYRLIREDVGEVDYEPGVVRIMVGALSEYAEDADSKNELAAYKERKQLRMVADLQSIGVPGSYLSEILKDAESQP